MDIKDKINEVERARAERTSSIVTEWGEEAPEAVRSGTPPSRVIADIAARHGMTAQGVELILRREGVYHGAKEFKEEVNQD